MTNNKTLSESEEMYLVTIHRVCEYCLDTPIPIPEIAKELGVQPVSVNQMINKLAESGYVKYLPYKGVELTPEGRQVSTRIVRHRRLWEVFFVKQLNMDLDEADRLACQMEHATTVELAERLYDFLEKPVVCCHGNPIPAAEGGEYMLPVGLPLEHLKPGQSSTVLRVEAEATTAQFLADQGIQPGVQITVLATGHSGDRLLEAQGRRIHVTSNLLGVVLVSGSQLMRGAEEKTDPM